MARARNIKPAFFSNDLLAEIEPIGRLLFVGLWTISDYKGCIEWRPKRIKAQVLPYDDCDIEKIAINLDKSGFIQFYSVQGVNYLKIVNFNKHQNPHKNERDKGSSIPDINCEDSQAIEIKGENEESRIIAINPDKNETNPADSLNLIPETFNPLPDSLEEKPKKKKTVFAKPSIQDAYDYFFEKTCDNNYSKVESEKWWYFYDSKDWVVGKNKMKNWKSSISGWINRNSNQATQPRYANQKQVGDNNDLSWMNNEVLNNEIN